MSKNWTLHPALAKLRDQIDARWPDRSRASDGTIGNTAHAARKSDHNPDANGVVCAMDITHDPGPPFQPIGCDGQYIAEMLRVSRDPRIKYVIWDHRIFSSTVQPWVWRPYTGANPHTKHVHISVGGDQPPWSI